MRAAAPPLLALLLLAGCERTPDRPVSSDGVRHEGATPPPAGAVARGTAAARAQARSAPAHPDLGARAYATHCAVCHGSTGAGDGPIIAHGFTRPRAFTALSAAEADPRRTVEIIEHGYGAMLAQDDQVPAAARLPIGRHVQRLARR